MPTATDFKDYYQILGVSKTATPDEIKRAYRKLARQYHPDLNPGDRQAETRFKELNEAHEVLSDPEKRQKYDQFGQYWKQAGEGGAPPPRSANVKTEGFDFNQYADFEEFVNDLLGRTNGGGRDRKTYTYRTWTPEGETNGYGDRASAPGPDREAAISLTFSEAFHGVQKQLRLNGETINVRIPAGAKPGSRVRVKGKGGISPFSQQRGDLYLTLEILPHPFFQFEGDRLIGEVPIRPDEAVLGVQVPVPTPDGIVTMTIPPGVRSGQALRLRGKGWVLPQGDRTDLLVKIQIVSPPEISDLEREYYEKIQANSNFNPRSHLDEVKL